MKLMIWNLKITTTKLDSTRNSEHKLYDSWYIYIMYILLKLKPGSLPLAIELHQPGIHFYHVLKKHHLLASLKRSKIQIYYFIFILMSQR